MSEVLETLADDAPALLMGVGLVVMFVAGAADFDIVAALGLALLVAGPLVGGTVRDLLLAYAAAEDEATATADPLEALRERYARGELTEAEFERKLERLLETEDLDVPGGAATGETDREREAES
jgi:uncharacterized membrane protein